MSIVSIPSTNIVELIDGGEKNPYHFFFYMISNFIQLELNFPIIYYYKKSKYEYVEQLLELLPKNFIRHYEKKDEYKYIPFLSSSKFKFIRYKFHSDWSMPNEYNLIRQLFKDHYNPILKKKKFIYISRNDAKLRRVNNEELLMNVLKIFGFEMIIMSKLSAKEQINIFAESDIVIAPHGAALAFSVFSNKDLTLLELSIDKEGKQHYQHIAWYLNLDYYKFQCEIIDNEFGEKDMIVDINRIVGFLTLHPKLN